MVSPKTAVLAHTTILAVIGDTGIGDTNIEDMSPIRSILAILAISFTGHFGRYRKHKYWSQKCFNNKDDP